MRIAIISSGFLPVVDGVTVSLHERLKRLSAWGHQVLVFCPDYSPLAHLYPNWREFTGDMLPGVIVIPVKSTILFWGLIDDDRNIGIGSRREIEQHLAQFQPEVIHVDEPERLWTGGFHLPGIRFAQRTNTPCISFYRTNFIDYREDYLPLPDWMVVPFKFFFMKFIRSIYNPYDLTLVASPITHRRLIDDRIKNAHCADLLGVDLQKFSPTLRKANYFKETHNLPAVDERLKIIFLGRLRPDKGWHFTLNALPQIAATIDLDRVEFLVAGDGELYAEIEQAFQKHVPHAHMLGQISPQDVPALLANCDIHVTASEKETRGLTVLEALASGTSVLVPERGGVMQDVQAGRNGFMFQPQNQADFIAKLNRLIEDHELRQTMAKNGPDAVAHYDWDQAVRRWLAIVNDLITTKKRSLTPTQVEA